MSVAAVRREIAAIERHGYFRVADARSLTSTTTLGKQVSPAEHALLSMLQDRVDLGYIASSHQARAALSAKVAKGPTGFFTIAKDVFVGGLRTGAIGGLIGGAVAALAAFLTAPAGWADLAMASSGLVGAGAGASLGVAIGGFRSIKD